MKKLLVLYFLLLSFAGYTQIEKAIPPAPSPPRLVNDFTGHFLTRDQLNALENKLVAYDDSTSNQIAVVIIDDLKGYSIDEYAIALGRKWGVGGQKEVSNGIVVLVNTDEKGSGNERGVFITTGYGMEGAVTDLVSQQIVDGIIIPDFKEGNNYRGLDEGTDALIQVAEGRYKAPEGYANRGKGKGMSTVGLIILIIVIIIVLSSMGGNNGGGYVSRRGYRGGGGWIFPTGGFGGGSGWSGGGGGGGFGGFGGGGFGGGGAGGRW